MKKRWLWGLMIPVLILSSMALPARAAEVEVAAPSAILIDAATGTVLYEKNADERLEPASVTKVMTLLLVMEALDSGRINWDDMVTASDHAAGKGGSQIYLEPGEQLSMDEMLKSVVVASANDCATALAEHIAGSETAFVDMMNRRAQELGCENTLFVNCTGLDDEPEAKEHLTTARDLALISRQLLTHDEIRKYTTIWMDTVRDGKFGLSNTNKLVRFYNGTTGLKTGYTSAAGHCLSASAERDGMELIAVVLHCGSSTERFESAKALLDYGFANFALVRPQLDESLPTIPVHLGTEETVSLRLPELPPVLIDKSRQASVEKKLELTERLEAPVEAGQQVGTLTITADGELLEEVPVVTDHSVDKVTWWQMTMEVLKALLMA